MMKQNLPQRGRHGWGLRNFDYRLHLNFEKRKKLPHLRHHEVMRIVFTIVAVRALVAEVSK